MCDYSLEHYSSRPARENEPYKTHRFPSGSIGLVSPGDCSTAICVQYDTRIRLENLPQTMQHLLNGAQSAEAVFVRLDQHGHRDGLQLENGQRISLQQLDVGLDVVVTQLLENVAPRAFEPQPRENSRLSALFGV